MSLYDELQELKRDDLIRSGYDRNPTVGGLILPFDCFVANVMKLRICSFVPSLRDSVRILFWLLPICCPYGTHLRHSVHGVRTCFCSRQYDCPRAPRYATNYYALATSRRDIILVERAYQFERNPVGMTQWRFDEPVYNKHAVEKLESLS